MSLAILNTTTKPERSQDSFIDRNLSTLRVAIDEAVSSIAPVWPLADYVAVNPYQAWSEHRFENAMAGLHRLSGIENIPSWSQLQQIFAHEQIDAQTVAETIANSADLQELLDTNAAESTAEDLLRQLHSASVSEAETGEFESAKIRTVVDVLSEWYRRDYGRHIHEQIGRFCESHFDQGFATWQSSTQDQSLYQAWKHASQWNLASPLRGIRNFRKLVRELPSQPEAAIAQCLREIRLPEKHWNVYLLTLAHSLPGWFAYARFLDRQNEMSAADNASTKNTNHAAELLAILASYELILTKSFGFHVSWPDRLNTLSETLATDANQRLALLCAAERSFQHSLLDQLSAERPGTAAPHAQSKRSSSELSAQFVFCIDVRSERVRRCLESVDSGFETMGFAGFFGAPMQLQDLDGESVVNQLPVLLSPAFSVNEDIATQSNGEASHDLSCNARTKRLKKKSSQSLWKTFAGNASSCFTFVESVGLGYAWRMLQRTALPWTARESSPDAESLPQRETGPSCESLHHRGLSHEAQVALAKGILTNLGLTEGFARFVVLVGHESCSENNPLAASLECGACGGHSGEPNARFVASLLNTSRVRNGLQDQGITIPEETVFVGGVHNTTRCEIQLIEPADVDDKTNRDLKRVADKVNLATAVARQGLGQSSGGRNETGLDLVRRSQDWSQVRPEWGLAGNAAFIVGPRELTQGCKLDNSAFLHSYDASLDETGAVLELIMTAPMVVAHWINMQYYASTVNNRVYGSGTKTTHNVVGNFGILSGSDPDLQTGLPLESLSDGNQLVHLPRRLTATIAAPRERIDAILAKHDNVAQLVSNQWMHLFAIDDQKVFRRTASGDWELERCLDASVNQSQVDVPTEAMEQVDEPAMA
ncbi:MAG: putative inorganic carbon transporter subunit DabA [Aureliella sp.]